MLCRKPYMVGMLPVGCGQCLHCRINRRRLWTTRIILESYCHDTSCFATLTYSPDQLPAGGNLDPQHLELFWKRLRKRLSPRRIRYFAVGEYGDASWRPHYHAAVFNLSLLEAYHVEACWPYGFVRLDELNPETAQYIAGYTVKKLTSGGDPRLGGKVPEFARQSNRPGIGAAAAAVLSASLRPHLKSGEDPPNVVRINGKKRNIGRYLTKIIREAHLSNEQIQAIKDRFSMAKTAEMHALLQQEIEAGGLGCASTISAAADEGRAASIASRQQILNSKRTKL